MAVVNDDPVANDDTATTNEDEAVTVDVLANDTDADGDTLTIQSVTNGANGTVVNNGTDVTYTPNADFNGTDNFSYTISDGNGGTDAATVTVTVEPVNDDPVAEDDTASTDEDTAVTIDVLANDADVDVADTLTVQSVTDGADGTVANNGTDVTYTPDPNFSGTDTFTYVVSDGNGGSDTATVTVTVAAVDDPPIADAGPDQNVLSTDLVQLDGSGSSDPEGATLSYAWTVASGPAGSAVNFSDPTIASPTASFSDLGTYVLQLEVSAAGQSDTDTVAILVSAAPTLGISNASVTEGNSGTTTATFNVTLSAPVNRVVTVQFATADGTATVADNDYVANGGTVTFPANTTAPQLISVTVNGDINIEPNENFVVNLSAPVNAQFGDSQGVGTIVNDDAAANLSLTPSTLGLLTFANGSLTVNLSAQAGAGGVEVTLDSSDPSIASVPATVTVAQGDTTAAVPVTGGSNTGGTTITASAPGFTTDTSLVTVNSRGLNIALDEPLVGVGRSISGSVTLAQAAPAGGVTLSLASAATGIATVAPGTVNIPAGQNSATFDVSGVSVGIASISASAPGFTTDSITATVTNNLVNLGLVNDIAPGQTTGLPLSITNPAPPGGLTVNFVSSDPSVATVTPSITIPAGLQLPAANPQVTGVNIGSAVITATASGFAPDNRAVNVTITFDFSPVNFTVVETNTADITLSLSAPAPAGGLVVPLSMANTGIATVPADITVPVGQTSALVPVTGVLPGDTVLSTTLPGTTAGTANIEVIPAPPINIGNNTIGDDLQVAQGGNLGEPAPAGGVVVTITSSDPSRLLLAPDSTTAGTPSITRTVNAGTSGVGSFFLQALDDTGTVEFTSSAPGYASDTSTVTLTPSGIDINSPGSFTTTSFSGNTNIQLCAWRLDPTTLVRQASQQVRGGFSVDTLIETDDPDVGVMTNSPVTLSGGQNCISDTQFDPIGAGVTTISITQAAGFQVPSARQSIQATVSAPNVNLPASAIIGEDLQASFSVSLQSAPPAPVDVTVTIADPTRAVISNNQTVLGGDTVTFVGVTGTGVGTIYLHGLVTGDTTISATAPGYNADVMNIQVQPSGFDINSPGAINTQTFANNTGVQICAWRLDPTTLIRGASQRLRPGVTANVAVTSSDTNVGVITSSPVVFDSSTSNCLGTAFDPLNGGTTTIAIAQPTGFETPGGTNPRQEITATVTAPNVNLPTLSNVGEDLQASFSISLQNAPPSPVDVVVTIDNPSVAVISNGATTVGGNTITFPGVSSTSVGTIWVQGLSEGTATITATATGYNTDTTAVTVFPSGFDINSPSVINTQTFANNTSVQVCAWRLDATTLARANSQNVRAGLSVSVPVTSSDTSVGVITTSPVVVAQNSNCANTLFDPVSNGTTQIAIQTPTDFDTPQGANPRQEITATVVAPTLNLPATRLVGSDLQLATTVTLQNAPPNPVDVTITSTAPSIVTLSTDPLLAGGGSVTFSGVTGTTVGTIYVQGRAIGGADIVGTAAGYQDDTSNVTVDPSGFDINSPGSITTTAAGNNVNVQVCAWRLDPTFLNRQNSQNVRGGLTANVPVTSSDTGVGTITVSPLPIGPNDNCENTQFDPASAGTTTISVTAPGGFETPSTRQSIIATVNP